AALLPLHNAAVDRVIEDLFDGVDGPHGPEAEIDPGPVHVPGDLGAVHPRVVEEVDLTSRLDSFLADRLAILVPVLFTLTGQLRQGLGMTVWIKDGITVQVTSLARLLRTGDVTRVGLAPLLDQAESLNPLGRDADPIVSKWHNRSIISPLVRVQKHPARDVS